jgi:multidrug resistance efflux pump
MVRRIVGVLVVAALLLAALLYSRFRPGPLKVSGFIEADEIRLGSRVGGRVAKVLVEEGQTIHAGDVLAELDPYDLYERRAEAAAQLEQRRAVHERLSSGLRDEEKAQAKARLEQLTAKLEELQHGPRPQEIKAAQADLDLAQAELDRAQEAHRRIARLFAEMAASQDQMDRASADLQVALARVRARTEQLDLLKEGTRTEAIAAAEAQRREAEQAWRLAEKGYRQEEINEAYAAVNAAKSALEAIERQLAELKIVAPVDGTVEALELQPGDLVFANAPAVSLIDMQRVWVRAYVPEDRLDLALGDRLPVTVDSYPGKRFTGEITFISRQAEFTPSNVQTPEERSKQVFRVKVTLVDGLDQLRPGMAADVWLEEK